jgi:cyclohexyl-isocyanide hydratase
MPLRFGLLCFPGVQQLDLTGPYEVFASAKGATVHLVWKDLQPVRSATGLMLTPDTLLAEAPDFDVLCIPGGSGVNDLLLDDTVLAFVRNKAERARFVTSVCTGSLVLGRAGLLQGKRATTHWSAMGFLPALGAIPVAERVVQDGSVITAGGVTSGIDFGLHVVAELVGREEAETIQLLFEYNPAPPFDAGSPASASDAVIAAATARMAGAQREREALLG